MEEMKIAEPDTSAENLSALSEKLISSLRIRTIPLAMKLYSDVDEMMAVPGVRTPTKEFHFTMCQLVGQARTTGYTLGVVHENTRMHSNCGAVVGLNLPDESYLSGDRMNGVWFQNKEAARLHQAQMPRVEPRYSGLCISPLRSGRLSPPDIVLFWANPAQTILFVNGLQWKTYKRYDMTITGESACADSWGRALKTGETSISIPCFAERRYGGVSDDEMLLAMPPHEFVRGMEGLAGLARSGLRYPIPPYGAQMDPARGLDVSYGDKDAS